MSLARIETFFASSLAWVLSTFLPPGWVLSVPPPRLEELRRLNYSLDVELQRERGENHEMGHRWGLMVGDTHTLHTPYGYPTYILQIPTYYTPP